MKNNWLPKLTESISESLPPGSNVARTLSDLFDVSAESIYRRMRGETSFSFEELMLLRQNFGISIDALLDAQDSISIRMKPLFDVTSLDQYLEDIWKEMKQLSAYSGAQFHCVAADIPIFRLLAYPALAAFKLFYWQKSILALPQFQGKAFNRNEVSAAGSDLMEKIAEGYQSIASVEIWNEQTINGTIKQIEYYADCKFFESEDHLIDLYRDLLQLVHHVSADAHNGYKASETSHTYALWDCELVMDNNSVLVTTDKGELLALGFNSFNAFRCSHPTMIREYHAWLNSMLSRSTLLSGQADKHRIRFIQNLIDRVNASAQSQLSANGFQLYQRELKSS